MNVFSYETKTMLKSSILWGIGLALGAMLFIFMFPGFAKDMKVFREMLAAYPPAVLTAFGAELDIIESFFGFYAFGMIYLIFAGAVQGMMLGIYCVAREYNGKTAEFLFTKPMSRVWLLQNKLLAALLNATITVVIYSVLAWICAVNVIDSVDNTKFLLLSIALFFIEVIFLSLGFLLGALAGKVKSPIMLSLGIVSGFFLLEMIGNSSDDLWIKVVSIFNYFAPSKLVEKGGFELKYIFLWAIITVGSVVFGLLSFQKKDIHVG